MKPGVVELAQKTEKPVIPVRSRCSQAWHFPRAWNKTYLPKPFARIEVEYGQPVRLGTGAEAISIDAACRQIKAELDALPGQTP